jgi:hypothetical protein
LLKADTFLIYNKDFEHKAFYLNNIRLKLSHICYGSSEFRFLCILNSYL